MRQIELYPKYFVSKDGTITSYYKYSTGIKLKHIDHSSGYLVVKMTNDDGQLAHLVHRLVATAFIPNPLNLPEVNHKDGDKHNPHYLNLEWSTESNNIKHAYDNGLRLPMNGEINPNAKITERDVIEIRKMISEGVFYKDILSKFNIKQAMFYNIKLRKNWKHI